MGLFADAEGRIINLRRFAIPVEQRPRHTPVVIAIAGTSMNSGKTTTASSLVHGLSRAGLRVSAAKVTGTGSGGDLWSLVDAGAEKVLDFTDMGYATTANLEPLEVEHVALSIINTLSSDLVDVIIIEIADGVLQKETAQLLSSPRFKSRLNGIVFAAGDAMGAGAGVRWLRERDLPIMAVSGVVTTSPLGIRETEDATGLPVLGIASLMDPVLAAKLCFSLPEAAALTAG
ncbi:molybdopterin-guanine dinucleotide biosynthesis protein MobB [Brevundimonas sp.]|uniref:molybdopterin-guanine dinucleotide biosynthesis protein MobB n=1 Tax=Brevundimonas sp. TaxID=1871086 RepID=UPI002730019E|nr:molybdopterin-guanine dinucleotide biosynthesis protein MobB [Brevundimonas sp.]MDP1914107.1 molybdopterin-guanine dinucleotide biosynthesis protein MobB [Brevundimonas sp.]